MFQNAHDKTLSIHLTHLEPLRVASLVGRGNTPELNGWKTMLDWARAKQLLDIEPAPRFFGFNVFLKDRTHHDYEVWMTVTSDIRSDDTVTVKEFPGGLYAVTRVRGVPHISDVWEQLVEWLRSSPYRQGAHQWLEEHVQFIDLPEHEFLLDLYLPLQQ